MQEMVHFFYGSMTLACSTFFIIQYRYPVPLLHFSILFNPQTYVNSFPQYGTKNLKFLITSYVYIRDSISALIGVISSL